MNDLVEIHPDWIPSQQLVLADYQRRHATGVHIADPFTVAEQRGSAYRLHHFNDERHMQAWVVVVFRKIRNKKRNFITRPQDAQGYRIRPDGDHIHEYSDAILQAIDDLEAGRLNVHDFDFYAVGDAPQAILDLIEPDPFAADRAAYARVGGTI